MANHGWVKTRKVMTPDRIMEMLAELNKNLFKNKLTIDYHNCVDQPGASGPHVWYLSMESDGNRWMDRPCWLKTSRHFEMRHSGGGDFAWWIDSAILNEVALRFNGTISDDGVDETWKGEPGKYDTWPDYAKRSLEHVKNKATRTLLLIVKQEDAPPEFRQKFGASALAFAAKTLRQWKNGFKAGN